MNSPALVVSAGGEGGKVVDHLERCRRTELAALTQRVAAGRPVEGMHQRLEFLRTSFRVLKIDLAKETAQGLPPSVSGELDVLPAGATLHPVLPGPEMTGLIRTGRLPGFDLYNPRLAAAAAATDGAMAIPNFGALAFTASIPEADALIRGVFRTFTATRRERFDTMGKPNVILVSGAYGGTGTGIRTPLEELLMDAVHDVFGALDAVDFRKILLVTGSIAGKDPCRSRALSSTAHRMEAARATGHVRRPVTRAGSHQIELVRPVQTILFSDEGDAKGTPVTADAADFAGLVGTWTWHLLTCPAGAQLRTRAVDLDPRNAQTTDLGEALAARSGGVALIDLPIARIDAYARARFAAGVLDHLLQGVDPQQVDAQSQAFFEGQGLVEGQGVDDLSTRIAADEGGGSRLADQLRDRFERQAGEFAGAEFIEHAGAAMALVAQQFDAETATARAANAVFQSVVGRLEADCDRLRRDPDAGPAAALQYLECTAGRAAHLSGEAGRDSGRFEEAVREAEIRVTHSEGVFAPSVRGMGNFRRLVHRTRVDEGALHYRTALLDREQARLRALAHGEAVRLLERLDQHARERADTLRPLLDCFRRERALADAERARLGSLPTGSTCPVGLSLVGGEEDLERYYQRLLGPEGEPAAVRLAAVRAAGVASRGNADMEVRGALTEAAMAILGPGVDRLHVLDELDRRYPADDDLLGALRQRNHEAAERLPLKDSTTPLYGTYRVAVVGLDLARGGRLTRLLAASPEHTTLPYEPVDTRDRERVVFLRLRGAFPFSAWLRQEREAGAYDAESKLTADERLHVYPGDRFVPVPGKPMGREDAEVTLIRAHLLGRVTCDGQTDGPCLQRGPGELGVGGTGRLVFDGDPAAALPLGPKLEVLLVPSNHGKEAYGIAVDVWSHLGCAVRLFGLDPLDRALSSLRPPKPGPAKVADTALAGLVSDAAIGRVRSELNWWRTNTACSTLGWGRGLRALRTVA